MGPQAEGPAAVARELDPRSMDPSARRLSRRGCLAARVWAAPWEVLSEHPPPTHPLPLAVRGLTTRAAIYKTHLKTHAGRERLRLILVAHLPAQDRLAVPAPRHDNLEARAKQARELSKRLVLVRGSSILPLNTISTTDFSSAGLVVDAERGVIVTDRWAAALGYGHRGGRGASPNLPGQEGGDNTNPDSESDIS